MNKMSLAVASLLLVTVPVFMNGASGSGIEVLDEFSKVIDGKVYTFHKMVNENGEGFMVVKDEFGNVVDPKIKSSKDSLYQKAKILLQNNKSSKLHIGVALNIDKNPIELAQSWGGASVDENGKYTYEEGGVSNETEVKEMADKLLRQKINLFAKRNGLENSKEIRQALLIPSSYVEVTLQRNKLLEFVKKNSTLIDGVDMAFQASTDGANLDFTSQDLSSEKEVLDKFVKTIDGKNYTFIKAQTPNGKGFTVAKDENGNLVNLNIEAKDNFARDIKQILNSKDKNVKIAVAIKADDMIPTTIESTGSVRVEKGKTYFTYNGMIVDKRAFEYFLEMEKSQKEDIRRGIRTNPNLVKFIERNSLSSDEFAKNSLNENLSYVEVTIKRDSIKDFVEKNRDLIDGVNLAGIPQDTLASAMLSTKINPYALNYNGKRGGGIGIYMSETGCPNPGFITNYRRLSGTKDPHNENVSGIIRGVSPQSYLYCRGGYTLPISSDISGYNGKPRIYIQTHSWGDKYSNNNQYKTSDRDVDIYAYNSDMVIFRAAGNFGKSGGYIASPSKALNIISVGNYNDANNAIAPSSSYKDSQIGDNKPEIVAPGINITAGGHTKHGTSMSAPHAAAFAADLMSQYSWLRLRPAFMKACMIASATKTISGGTDKVGVGGIDFYNATYDGVNWWFNGNNNSFDSYATNGYIIKKVKLKAGFKIRVAIAWFNRGEYIYSHRTAGNPLSMDLDLSVYAPNGNYVGGSASVNNPYEVVDFTPSQSGEYTIKIKRFANNDTNCALKLGLSIQ